MRKHTLLIIILALIAPVGSFLHLQTIAMKSTSASIHEFCHKQETACNTKSISLNGSSQYLTAADNASLSFTGDHTFEVWIKLNTTNFPDQHVGILGKSIIGSTSDYRLYIYNYGGLKRVYCFYWDDSNDLTDGYIEMPVSFSTTNWMHIAVAVDVSASTMDFYIDDTKVTGTMFISNAKSVRNSNGLLSIGLSKLFTTNAAYFPGLIDEVRIWNCIRTEAEISANYKKELVGNEAGLVGYWKFNDNFNDSSPNGNTLTSGGAATLSTNVPFSCKTNSIFFGTNF